MSALPVTIIMIEDDEGHARLIEKKRAPCPASTTRSCIFLDGTSALQHLETPETRGQGPLLVLLDLNLPDMSGTDILARIKQKRVDQTCAGDRAHHHR